MASRRRPSKSGTPLDERQRKLIEEQEIIQQRVEQLNRVIADAPRIKAERARARREELLTDRGTRAHHRLNSTILTDTRYDAGPSASPSRSRSRPRPLKAERRQTLLIFLSLLVVLGILVFWLLSVWHWQWPG